MKRIVSTALAISLVASVATTSYAASAPTYRVGSISPNGYLLDEDDSTVVDMSSSEDIVGYGQTIYFPLLNAGGGDYSSFREAVEEATAAYEEAVSANQAAIAELRELEAVEDDVRAAQAVKAEKDRLLLTAEQAVCLDQSKGTYAEAKTTILAEREALQGKINSYNSAVTALGGETAIIAIEQYKQARAACESAGMTDYLTAYDAAPDPSNTTAGAVKTAYDSLTLEQQDYANSLVSAKGARNYDTVKYNAYVTAKGALTGGEATRITEIDELLAAVSSAQLEVTSATAAYNVALTRLPSDAEREAIRNAAQEAEDAAVDALAAKEAAEEALENAIAGAYKYVYESTAVKNIKIKKDWDEGKSYVSSVEIAKKKYEPCDYSGSQKYAYFVAVSIKKSSTNSTSTKELSGTVNLKKSGDYGFEYDDMELDISLEIGCDDVEGDLEIPKIPKLFSEGSGFDGDGLEQFDFEADDSSWFEVNTSGQKDIVLGLDTDYDDEIADEYPGADLEFWNGNGAKFNRTGTLHLYSESGKYVYGINSSGELYNVESDYESSDECFEIRTRVLGRYVVSNRVLNVKNGNDVISVVDSEGNVTNVSSADANKGDASVINNPETGAKA